jgi:frataxin-like iron-binding protein CyaY
MFNNAMNTLTEQEFRVRSDEAIEQARRMLMPLADQEGFEIELRDGVLDLMFEEPTSARFVVSPNAPVRQIWVSAISRSYKLAWTPERQTFALDHESLPDLLTRLVRTFLSS